MGFKFVLLWTDVALYALVAGLVFYVWRIRHQPNSKANWMKVLRDPAALCSLAVLLLFVAVAVLDSVHFRRQLDVAGSGATGGQVYYNTRTESLLDVAMADQIRMREVSWSAPLAYQGFAKEPVQRGADIVREHARLGHGGAHLKNPRQEWQADIIARTLQGLLGGAVAFAVCVVVAGSLLARSHGGLRNGLTDLARGHTDYPLRPLMATLLVICLLAGPMMALMDAYHVFGTDRTGNDVLYQALKSVRTAFVIGTLATIATLPFAIVLGILGGYFKGWVDELIQYIYTTLTAVPSVLLIAACVLMMQVFLDKHPELFETGAERSDIKIFLLCVILGLTGWATLCRLVRGETLKLRELDYVQAAVAFGVSHARIMSRHILPNVMHLVLITTVLSFSDLILFEAVLTYIGVGVDPSMNSFGGMINLARSEMSRNPVVWWSFAAAFTFMVVLVLAANLFADGVRDAFDPRSRSFRPRLIKRLLKAPAGTAGEPALTK
jgi:peptide/nickel transport system permease protein